MKDKFVFFVVLLVIAGLGTLAFRSVYERVEVKIRTDESAEVRSNKFYGFSRYLESFGIESAKLIDLNTRTQLPKLSDTLFLDLSSSALSDIEQQQLLDWVVAGGQLVIEIPYEFENSLLGRMGFTQMYNDDEFDEDTDDDIDNDIDEENATGQPSADEPDADRDSSGSDQELLADSGTDQIESRPFTAYLGDTRLGELESPYVFPKHYLDHRPVNWTLTAHDEKTGQSATNLFAFGFSYGLGHVTTVGQTYQIHNEFFSKLDHSFVMLKALTQNREPGKIWFVSTVTRPGLWDFLWQRAAHLILWVILGIICFFWWAGQRFGRTLPDPVQDRREFNEHIAASGRYLWHHHQRQALLEKTQRSFMQKVHRRFPHLRNAQPATRHQYMKDVIGDDIELWDIATGPSDDLNKVQFLEKISALQKLWKKI